MYKATKKILPILCLIPLLVMVYGCIVKTPVVLAGVSRYGSFSVLLMLLSSALLVVLLRFAFDGINRASGRTDCIISIVMLAVMGLLCLILLICLNPKPTTDSFDDIDTAMYIIMYGPVTSDYYHAYVTSMYGNNYFLILIFAAAFKLLRKLGISDVVHAMHYFNAACLLLSIYLTYKIILLTKGIKRANKVLLLCIINPIFYCLIFWVYSLIISLPIMMGIIFVAVLLGRRIQSKEGMNNPAVYVLSVLMGVLIYLGYEIRPTAIFTFIALTVWVLVSGIKKDLVKKYLILATIILASIALLWSVGSRTKDHYFSQISDENYPIWFWLSMGSHGDGSLSGQGEECGIFYALDDANQRSNELRYNTLKHYKELGIGGTLRLWGLKTMITWSDGYSSVGGRINTGEMTSTVFELLGGNNNYIFKLYCMTYRFTLILSILVMCVLALCHSCMFLDNIDFIALITFLGGIFFYFIWESKNIYSASFIPVMCVLAEQMQGQACAMGKATDKGSRKVYVIVAVTLTVVCGTMLCITRSKSGTLIYSRINTLNNDRSNIWITDNRRIEQSFRVEGDFNRIIIMATGNPAEAAPYDYEIFDRSGTLLRSGIMSADMIENDCICIDFATIEDAGEYVLVITKQDESMADITFYTKNTYYLDSYRGTLKVGPIDGNVEYVNDINMDVSLIVEKDIK